MARKTYTLEQLRHRHVCTKESPWTRRKSFYGDHPDAVEVEREENVITYDCPHCGRRFREWTGPNPFDWAQSSETPARGGESECG